VSAGQHFLGPYQLVRMIRAGQTCQVWEALPDGSTERIALKVLLKEHLGKAGYAEELKNEAMIGKDLEHPLIIKIIEYRGQHSRPLVAMELFHALNLRQWLRDDFDTLIRKIDPVVRDCTKSLAFMHKKGWLHCDVKPDNFLMNDEGQIKLIDFSIGKKIAKKSFFGSWGGGSKSKQIAGTRSYMAPEQIRKKHLDVRTDIYGLACSFFEMACGKLPYTASSPNDLLTKHLNAPIPALLAANPMVSEDFSNMVAKMMAKKPEDRYQSMEDVSRALRNIRVLKAGAIRKMDERKKDQL